MAFCVFCICMFFHIYGQVVCFVFVFLMYFPPVCSEFGCRLISSVNDRLKTLFCGLFVEQDVKLLTYPVETLVI